MKKNKKLLVVVGVLIILGGIAFAYFVGRMLTGGNGASTTVTTAQLQNSTVTVSGELTFNDLDILPGHKNVSAIKVTATGNNELIPYNLIWDGNNGLNTTLNFTVYKTSELIEGVKANCAKIHKPIKGGTAYLEECSINNQDKLGEVVASGTIGMGEVKETLVADEFITSTANGNTMYYYVVLEYPNLNEDQYPVDKDGNFDGVLTVEPSEAKPDITILAAYVQNEETGKYEKKDDIPQDGYTINKKLSQCSNEAIPGYDLENKRVYFEKLTKSGTECELYFDIYRSPAEYTLANINLSKDGILGESVTGTACESGCKITDQNGVYETEDDDGKSYIFRGTVSNNWVKFGKKGNDDIWWRIIRINGDGTIRLIYAGEGTAPTGNGKNIETTNIQYNSTDNDNTYVGYYTGATGEGDFTKTHSNTTQSIVATRVEKWFSKDTNLNEAAQLNHIDENAGFCNNRQISDTAQKWWSKEETENRGTGTVVTAYKGWYNAMTSSVYWSWRSDVNYANLKCSSNADNFEDNTDYKRDYYTWKGHAKRGNQALAYPVGLITMDEVILAGGFGKNTNSGYWLNSGTDYWTMSPWSMYTNGYANVFYVNAGGNLDYSYVNLTSHGVRPVINLKADTEFNPSNGQGQWGTKENPYVVA